MLVSSLILFGAIISQPRINVYVADPRGGRGDIAANFLMAERLKRMRPEADVRLLVPRNSLSVAKFLEPKLEDEKRTDFKGIPVIPYSRGLQVPKADAVLSFSTNGDPVDGGVADSAPWILLFQEPEDALKTQVTTVPGNPQDEPQVLKTLILQTGPGNLGSYVTVDGRKRKHFDELREPLAAETGISLEDIPNLNGDGLLAMGYSSNSAVTMAYREHAIEFARRVLGRRGDQPILFILNQKGWADVDYDIPPLAAEPNRIERLGADVYLIPYQRLSLGLSEDLFGASDLPPLTTGDGSQAMALEHGRTSFYELQGWKVGSYLDHLSTLRTQLNEDLNWGSALSLSVIENENFRMAQRRKPHGPLDVEIDTRSLKLNSERLARIDAAVARARSEGSLAANVWTIVDEVSTKFPKESKTSFEHGFRAESLDAFVKFNCPSAVTKLQRAFRPQ